MTSTDACQTTNAPLSLGLNNDRQNMGGVALQGADIDMTDTTNQTGLPR